MPLLANKATNSPVTGYGTIPLMCGRFLNRTPASETARIFNPKGAMPNWPPRYNLAPRQGALAVRFNAETKERTLDVLRWGLIP